MVHIAVFILFVECVFFPLFLYSKTKYAIIVLVTFSLFIVFKFLYHIKRSILFILALFIATFLLQQYFVYRTHYFNSIYNAGFKFKHAENIEISGTIYEFPEYRFSNNQYVLSIDAAQVKILVFTESYQKFSYGDILNIQGKISDVREQDKQWHQYYKKIGVQYIIFNSEIKYIGQKSSMSLSEIVLQKLFTLKVFLRAVVIDKFSSYASALVLGMLLGEKEELSKDENEVFNRVGLSHILVVSGYNISLLVSFIFIVLKNLNKKMRIVVALSFTFLFVLLVGGEGSVVRAALMGSIIIFSKIARRPTSALNVLFYVASIMLMYSPYYIFDAGFHLSFIATFSLLILPKFKNMPEFVVVTIWVFIFVSPYIIYLSGYIALGSVISNILVVLLLPIFMFVSFVSILLGMSRIYIGIDILILETISRYIFVVSSVIEKFPQLNINITPPFLAVLYSLFCVIFIFLKNKYTTLEFIEKHYQKFVPRHPN